MKGSHVSTTSKLREVAVESVPGVQPMAAVRITCTKVFRAMAEKYWEEHGTGRT